MAKKKSKAKAIAHANQAPEAAPPPSLKKATRKRTRKSRSPKMSQGLQPVGGPSPTGMRPWLKLPKTALMKASFDPAVSTKTAEEVLLEWVETSKLFMKRPSKRKYFAGKGRANLGQYSYGRIFTEFTPDKNTGLPESDLRNVFLGWMPYGKTIGEMLAEDGYKTLESFAAADMASWKAISNSMASHLSQRPRPSLTANTQALYNYQTRKFRSFPCGTVFLAVNSEYTTGQVLSDPLKGSEREKGARDRVVKIVEQIWEYCNPVHPHWDADNDPGELPDELPMVGLMTRLYPGGIVPQVRSLPDIENFAEKAKKALGPSDRLVHRPLSQTALDDTFNLIHAVYQRRNRTRILYLMNIPMLDRRLVAIMLRDSPNVTMVGIYDCPLIHFGDVITLLDLIHQINNGRKTKGLPLITSLDFFPHFNSGIPFKHPTAMACGVTWSEIPSELAQKGIFRILMEAFLKAKAMGIKLLFDEGKAFRKFLSQIPLIPTAVEYFLDGLHRYCSLMESQPERSPESSQALFDLLMYVALGVEGLPRNTEKWFNETMGKNLVFCSSCGHDMLEEFFTAHTRRVAQPYSRVCVGCQLRNAMDTEAQHQAVEQRIAITNLFNTWNQQGFNPDAPIHASGRTIFRLRTRVNIRAPPPAPQMNAHGHLIQPRFMYQLVRDNKIHFDSVQNLPTVAQLMSETLASQRSLSIFHAMMTDVDRIVANVLSQHYQTWEGGVKPYGDTRADAGRPNSEDEAQRVFSSSQAIPAMQHGHRAAAAFFYDLLNRKS